MANSDISDEEMQEIMRSGDQLPESFYDEVLATAIMINPTFNGEKIIDNNIGE